MNRPSFFIVGAVHCATATLYRTLQKHPGIFLPPNDAPEKNWLQDESYQDSEEAADAAWQRAVEEGSYLANFEAAPDDRILGSAIPWKLHSAEVPGYLKAFAPKGKVVIMLRPPVTWMRSRHHDLLRRGYENKVSFREALDEAEAHANGKNLPRREVSPSFFAYREAARFSAQVERYYEVLGRENVFVGLAEDLENDAPTFLGELLQFLGVGSSTVPEVAEEIESSPLRGTHHFDLAVGRTVDRLPGGKGLKRFFGRGLQGRYQKFIEGIFAPMSDQKIESILEEELLEEFEPEVRRLGKLIGRDLSHWNEARFPRSEHDHDHHH